MSVRAALSNNDKHMPGASCTYASGGCGRGRWLTAMHVVHCAHDGDLPTGPWATQGWMMEDGRRALLGVAMIEALS
jgi:hypothetical protein